jgi:hypothetical protein
MSDVITYIRFEEGSGLNAADETGLLNGELNNFPDTSPGAGDTGIGWSTSVSSPTVPLTGQPNTGSLRMGPIAYVDVSNGNDLSLGTEFTIEFYMKPDQPPIGSSTFGFEPGSRLFFPLIVDGGQLMWRPQFQGQFDLIPADLVSTGEWQHFALVMEPTNYNVYINGQIQYIGPIPSGGEGPYFFPGTDETGDRTIGGESGTFYGWIDEFRISDTALTPDQFLGAFPIPEPSTFLLTLLGLYVFGLRRRKGSRL